MAGKPLSKTVLAALAAPCLPLAALGLPLVVYLPEYFSGEIGLSLTAVGTAFMAVRLLDMAFDPFIGGVMDRTRTRWGRFRLWFAIGTPILMFATWMLFMARPGVGVAYLWIGLLVIYGGFSIATLSHMAWASVLTPDYDQRSRVYGWWQTANVIGMILVLALPPLLFQVYGATHAQGVQAMGLFIIILLPITLLLSLFIVPEPRIASAPDKAGIREYLGLFKRASVRRILIVDILNGTGPAITGALFFFYFHALKDFDRGPAGLLLLIYFVGGLVGAPIWMWISYRLGKHRTLAYSGLFYAAIQVAVVLMPAGHFPLASACMLLAGLSYSASAFLLRAMMADVGDEERLDSGVDRTGLLYALLTGTVKIGSALAVFVTFRGLDVAGFQTQAGAVNDPSALLALQLMFTAAPGALAIAGAWVIWGYPLTAEKHAEVRARLAEKDLAEAAPELGSEPRIAEEVHPLARPAE